MVGQTALNLTESGSLECLGVHLIVANLPAICASGAVELRDSTTTLLAQQA